MVFRPRVESYNPINDIFAITNLSGNQFYANNENDLRSKNLHKSFVRSTLVVVNYENTRSSRCNPVTTGLVMTL